MQDFLRYSYLTDSNSRVTVNEYIVKFVKIAFFESQCIMLTAQDLANKIKEISDIEFSAAEISDAVSNYNQISYNFGQYSIDVSALDDVKNSKTNEERLKKYISEFSATFEEDFDCDELYSNLIEHIYSMLNSNIDALRAIIFNGEVELVDKSNTSFGVPQKMLMNRFLNWDNLSKNEFIFELVSFSIDYCRITIKQESENFKEYFNRKSFFLDTNIIFRLAGINSNERKTVTQKFVEKCTDVGIKLYYTNFTKQEVDRVIESNMGMIESLVRKIEPMSPEILLKINGYNDNDFYTLFYNWAKEKGNNYRNLPKFKEYVEGLFDSVFSILNYDEFIVSDAGSQQNSESENLVKSLEEYKAKNDKNGSYTKHKTDVENFLHVKSLNDKDSHQNTGKNNFFISADQTLGAWALIVLPHSPIIFRPSVWMGIILKFTGRTENDYKAFCSFMTLRFGQSQDDKDNYEQTIEAIVEKTKSSEIAEAIIREITYKGNRAKYSSMSIEERVDAAFDVVVKDRDATHSEKLAELSEIINSLENKVNILSSNNEDVNRNLKNANDTIKVLQDDIDCFPQKVDALFEKAAESIATGKRDSWNKKLNAKWPAVLVSLLTAVVTLVILAFPKIRITIINLFPDYEIEYDILIISGVALLFAALLWALLFFPFKFLSKYMSSEKRFKVVYEKELNKSKKRIKD